MHIFRHLFVCFQTSVYTLGEFHKNRNNSTVINPPPRGCAGGRIGTRFLRPSGTSPKKGGEPRGYRNGTESFFGLKGHPSVVRDV